MMGFFYLIMFAIVIVVLIGMWKVFEKAGQPGWKAIVPLYNLWTLVEIV
ncbi:MAG: signal peptidase I, partial [Actinobacteria bacterium]